MVEHYATAAALCRRLANEAQYDARKATVEYQEHWLGFVTVESRARNRRLMEAKRQYVRQTPPLWRRFARLFGMEEADYLGLTPTTLRWIRDVTLYLNEGGIGEFSPPALSAARVLKVFETTKYRWSMATIRLSTRWRTLRRLKGFRLPRAGANLAPP